MMQKFNNQHETGSQQHDLDSSPGKSLNGSFRKSGSGASSLWLLFVCLGCNILDVILFLFFVHLQLFLVFLSSYFARMLFLLFRLSFLVGKLDATRLNVKCFFCLSILFFTIFFMEFMQVFCKMIFMHLQHEVWMEVSENLTLVCNNDFLLFLFHLMGQGSTFIHLPHLNYALNRSLFSWLFLCIIDS